MLKFIGTFRNGSTILSRTSTWYISNYQIVATCTTSAVAPLVSNERVTDDESKLPLNITRKKNYPRVKLIFEEFSKSTTNKSDTGVALDSVESLLKVVDREEINVEELQRVHKILTKWEKTGKISSQMYENHPKYLKLCRSLIDNIRSITSVLNETKLDSPFKFDEFYELTQSYDAVKAIPTDQAIKILSVLTTKQRRIKPLLQAIAMNICNSKNKLGIRNCSNILYNMACLNFPDINMLDKICGELEESIHTIQQSPIMGSIITSLGMLRYRNNLLLNIISEWAVKHKSIFRTQDFTALIITLANVNFIPTNFDALMDSALKISEVDMTRPSEWLDFIWSLTILNKVTHQQLQTVLREGFIEKFKDASVPIGRKLKLLNINAAAKFLVADYPGPFIPSDSNLFNTLIIKSKEKTQFVNSVTDALINLFPSSKHFCTDTDHGIGFLLDVEFLMKDNRPILFEKGAEDAVRVAIMTTQYHDYSIGEKHPLGVIDLRQRLLEARNYRLINISYDEFNATHKLLTRITYLNDRIKFIMQ